MLRSASCASMRYGVAVELRPLDQCIPTSAVKMECALRVGQSDQIGNSKADESSSFVTGWYNVFAGNPSG